MGVAVYTTLREFIEDSELSEKEIKVWVEKIIPSLIRPEVSFLLRYFQGNPTSVRRMTDSIAQKAKRASAGDIAGVHALLHEEGKALLALLSR